MVVYDDCCAKSLHVYLIDWTQMQGGSDLIASATQKWRGSTCQIHRSGIVRTFLHGSGDSHDSVLIQFRATLTNIYEKNITITI